MVATAASTTSGSLSCGGAMTKNQSRSGIGRPAAVAIFSAFSAIAPWPR